MTCRLIILAFLLLVPCLALAQEASPEPDLRPLIDALKDDATRTKLLEALEAQAADTTPVPDTAAAEPSEDAQSELQGLSQRAAEVTTEFANTAYERMRAIWRDVARLRSLPTVLTEDRWQRIVAETPLLLATMAVTIAIYRLLRALARRRVGAPPSDAPLSTRAIAVLAQAGLRALGLSLSWITGYTLSWLFGGGEIAVVQALYLNGFLIVGLATFALSLFVSYDPRDVTLTALAPEAERTIFRQVRRVVVVLGYGLLTVVPISHVWTNFVIERSLRALIVTLAAILALVAIRRIATATKMAKPNKVSAPASIDEAGTLPELVATTTETIWSRIWPPLAVLYVLTAYWVAVTQPNLMFEILGRATGLTIVALALMIAGLQCLSAAGAWKIALPSFFRRNLPDLDVRLNHFVPAFSVVAGLVLVLVGLLFIAEGWELIAITQYLGAELLWRISSAALVLAATIVAWAVLSAWIDTRLQPEGAQRALSSRSRTLLSLLRNALTVALLVLGIVTALSELGVNIAPLLAGAGVIGLAIGFGAQKLVQDIINGVFIQLENAINEGDVVTVAGVTGSVETLTIRSVGIRDLSGVFHLIPFSAVDTVSNFMRGYAYHVETVGVAYDSNLDTVRAAMEEAFQSVRHGPLGFYVIGDLEMHGVIALGESSVDVRARIKTQPGQQWAVGRAYTEAVKASLDTHGVDIPYPHREIRLPADVSERLKRLGPEQPEDTEVSDANTPKTSS